MVVSPHETSPISLLANPNKYRNLSFHRFISVQDPALSLSNHFSFLYLTYIHVLLQGMVGFEEYIMLRLKLFYLCCESLCSFVRCKTPKKTIADCQSLHGVSHSVLPHNCMYVGPISFKDLPRQPSLPLPSDDLQLLRQFFKVELRPHRHSIPSSL